MTNNVNINWKMEKTDECSRVMRNTKKSLNGFKTFKKIQLQSGKTDDNPEVVFINKKIQEFEKDLQTLKINDPYQDISL
jgi:hypothetical protein